MNPTPTINLRLISDGRSARLQQEWLTGFGGTEWRDVPLVPVGYLPPRYDGGFDVKVGAP